MINNNVLSRTPIRVWTKICTLLPRADYNAEVLRIPIAQSVEFIPRNKVDNQVCESYYCNRIPFNASVPYSLQCKYAPPFLVGEAKADSDQIVGYDTCCAMVVI